MTARIAEIVDLMEEFCRLHNLRPHDSTKELRRVAVKTIAEQRRITPQTVNDKMIRQLKPEFTRLADFDNALNDWVSNRNRRLFDVLLVHGDHDDKERIQSFIERYGNRCNVAQGATRI